MMNCETNPVLAVTASMPACPPQEARITAFRDGLRETLLACSRVLSSENYLRYLRHAHQQGADDILCRAVRTGHGGLRDLVRSFLQEAVDQGIVTGVDVAFEAEYLLALTQGYDFIDALLCQQVIEPSHCLARIEAAVTAFCRANLRIGSAGVI